MSNPISAAYAALVQRVQLVASIVVGTAWTFPTLVQPVTGTDHWFWISMGGALLTTVYGIAAILETPVTHLPVLSLLLATVWRGGLRRVERLFITRDGETLSERGERQRTTLRNAVRSGVSFLTTVAVSIYAVISV